MKIVELNNWHYGEVDNELDVESLVNTHIRISYQNMSRLKSAVATLFNRYPHYNRLFLHVAYTKTYMKVTAVPTNRLKDAPNKPATKFVNEIMKSKLYNDWFLQLTRNGELVSPG